MLTLTYLAHDLRNSPQDKKPFVTRTTFAFTVAKRATFKINVPKLLRKSKTPHIPQMPLVPMLLILLLKPPLHSIMNKKHKKLIALIWSPHCNITFLKTTKDLRISSLLP
jgi:hypothetical protein